MMGKRIVFNYYIGLDGQHTAFENAVIEEASRLAGGCTVTFSLGHWIEGAEKTQSRYSGHLISERCFNLQLSVDIKRKMEINYTMRACIRQEAWTHSLDVNWVHVTTHEVNEHHFQVIPG